jgi:hypothetical protein
VERNFQGWNPKRLERLYSLKKNLAFHFLLLHIIYRKLDDTASTHFQKEEEDKDEEGKKKKQEKQKSKR